MNESGKHETRLVYGLRAVIISYDAKCGILLVQHRSSSSLEETVEAYLAESEHRRAWLASFHWDTIEPDDQRRTEQLLVDMRAAASEKEPKRARGKRGRGSRAGGRPTPKPTIADCSVADVLRGLVVDCALTKEPKWRAVSIAIDFDNPRFLLPKRAKSSKRQLRNDPLSDRLRRISESGRTNLFRPWRG